MAIIWATTIFPVPYTSFPEGALFLSYQHKHWVSSQQYEHPIKDMDQSVCHSWLFMDLGMKTPTCNGWGGGSMAKVLSAQAWKLSLDTRHHK